MEKMLDTDTQSDASVSLDIKHICIFSEADHRSIELMFLAKYIKRKVERINLNPISSHILRIIVS